jgi:hypothetical protein
MSLAGAAAAQTDAYIVSVEPILEKNCYSCHTAKMKGGLRLDSRETILQGGSSGPAIVPGHPESSLIVKAIQYQDEDLRMPPKGKLDDSDIAAIQSWINSSASDFAPRVSAAAPSVPAPQAVTATQMPPNIASAQEQYFESKVRPLLSANCYGCHTGRQAGGLRLDSRRDILAGGKDGAVIDLAHPENSLLLKAVHYNDQALQMPPKGPLATSDIAILEQWFKDGLVWPAGAPTAFNAVVSDADRSWWAYTKPIKPVVPNVSAKWAYNNIDKFILTELDEHRIAPVRDADKLTMIRRVTYDVTGLPPTPSEINAYLSDKSPDAYPKLVDRLLASKAYSERWARMWLDVVRYSDTTGEGADFPVPEMYKYRDYVIASFAADKPYDRFIKEQIAGDLLPASSEPEHWNNIIATGYLANSSRYQDNVADAVDNVGYAYLGTSIACARCHDHKFDPIPTADYYGIYGILASTQYSSSGMEEIRYERNMVYRDPNVVKSQQYIDFEAQLKPVADTIHAAHQLPYFDDILPALEARRMALFENAPHFESAYAVTEGTPHDEHIQHLGDKANLGDEVPRHFLQVLGNWKLPVDTKGSGRLELANWIASPNNPLTARVMVNRLWQGHFGRGIVATPNDYGKRGSPPSNQALLDYLATDFIAKGWSIKAMQREILLSHTYQLSSDNSGQAAKIDPEDIYLWRHARQRMDAEQIRDSMLASSGMLDTSPAGPQPFPREAEWNYSGHTPFHAIYETNRRTLYVMTQRTRRHPYLGIFDGPDATMSVAQRDSSITPLQTLYFMNGSFPKQCGISLAAVLEGEHLTQREEINRAFLLIYGRPAEKDELAHADQFLNSVTEIYQKQGPVQVPGQSASPLKTVGLGTTVASRTETNSSKYTAAYGQSAHRQALSNFIQALYASNEFMFID